ncbi:CD109 antigen-like [Watersipora subatra]|uniref:CD109 antigen-like n=1 Tax=Watersipora subatra TaxID=2589382 RepID=UPI00355C9B86
MKPMWLLAILGSACLFQLATSAELKKDPTYLIVAPTTVRPNQLLRISAAILKLEYESFTVTAIVRKLNGDNYDEICSTTETFSRVGNYEMTMLTRDSMSPGNYTLRVAGYSDSSQIGQIFSNDTELFFNGKEVSVFIQLSRPFYRQGQTVRLRVIPVQKNLMAVSTTMDVTIKDPDGYPVRKFYTQHTNAGGVVSLSYALSPNLVSFGDWTVQVYCQDYLYNKTFRVEEFYPPLFYVNVSMPTTMLRNSFGISGVVASNHTTGRGTKGSCIITLEILSMSSSEREPINTLTREIPYFDGRTDFMFNRQEMSENPNTLVGKELRVTARVLDWFYNTTSIGFQSAIVYIEDVEIKFLGGSVWSFKPELPFSIYIAGIKRDGSPLDPYNENRTINLEIAETDDIVGDRTRLDTVELSTETSVAEYVLYPKATTNRILVRAKYENEQDTRRELVATRFWSPNDYYIQLTTPTKSPSVGQYMIFNVKTNTFIEFIYYHIVAGGNILVSDTLQMFSRNKLFSVALSRDMAPNARIIAYFVAADGQVVVDSLNFNVNGSRLHEMTLRFNRGKDFTYSSVEISSTADPLSYVAFSAIEYQLYELGARNGLTWEEVYQELYTYDAPANTSISHYWLKQGQMEGSFNAPVPSYAHDANSTFFFAGLYAFSDANVSAVYTTCNKTQGYYPCMDGKSCYDFKDICTNREECGYDRRDEMGCFNNETYDVALYNGDKLWRTRHIRQYFLDGSFLWEDQFTKPDGRIDFKVDVPTYPTTWVVSGFAMSKDYGLAILPIPTQFDGVRPMYITVEGTSHVRNGEHMTLRVAVFNFWIEDMDVLLTVHSSDDYQFVELDLNTAVLGVPVDGPHQVLVPVFAGSNRQVLLPVRPRTFGHLVITISASCVVGGQTVVHHVFVDHYGVPEHYITSKQVDLTIANSERLPDMLLPVDEVVVDPEQRIQNYVPGSPKTRIFVLGDVVGVSFFPYTHYDLNSENLLRQPYGTGAEAVFNFAVNVYTLKLLRPLSSITMEEINKVLFTLNIALQEMMFYMQEDGSFKEFRWSDKSSTWLTAIALQALSDARTVSPDKFQDFEVPVVTLTKAAAWLAAQQDNSTGAFQEINTIYNRRFTSDFTLPFETEDETIEYRPSNLSLTALSVLALSQTGELSADANVAAQRATSLGAEYIEKYIEQVQDPFELSICLYALITAGKTTKESATLQRLNSMARKESQMIYWSTSPIEAIDKGHSGQDTVVRLLSKQFSNVTSYATSATSYAMLSNMKNSAPENDLKEMQKFLQEQHMWVGGFSSTQDTLIAMQALSVRAVNNQNRNTYALSFEFRSDQNENWFESFTIDQSNWFKQQVIETPSHWGSIQTVVKGHGVALIQLETTLNHEHEFQLRKPPNPVFHLGNYNNDIRTSGFNHSYIDYRICPSYIAGGQSGMSVMEVAVPSGYVVHNRTLQKYVLDARAANSTLRNAEYYNNKAVFYFDYLDQNEERSCVEFSAVRWFPVANITQTLSLKVFEYYEPGNFNYTLYEKVQLRTLTVCLVCGSYQCPYCPHYASAPGLTPSISLTAFTVIITLFLLKFQHISTILK